MAGKLKLYYFNGRGRGEVSRLLCKEGDIEFEDIRVDGKSDWKAGANLKDKMPFGQMPVLELKDGTKIAQSAAIERYLARLGKLYGKDETEAAVIDMVCEGLTDTLKGLMKALFESGSDENVKKSKHCQILRRRRERMAALGCAVECNSEGQQKRMVRRLFDFVGRHYLV